MRSLSALRRRMHSARSSPRSRALSAFSSALLHFRGLTPGLAPPAMHRQPSTPSEVASGAHTNELAPNLSRRCCQSLYSSVLRDSQAIVVTRFG